jgi:hypothetical protein
MGLTAGTRIHFGGLAGLILLLQVLDALPTGKIIRALGVQVPVERAADIFSSAGKAMGFHFSCKIRFSHKCCCLHVNVVELGRCGRFSFYRTWKTLCILMFLDELGLINF